jgi:hypothetical protein
VTDAINREQMRMKLMRMQDRIRKRRDGPYKCGYKDACNDALQKLNECSTLASDTVTRCHECRNALERQTTLPYCIIHNRRKNPDDFCNFGEPDE